MSVPLTLLEKLRGAHRPSDLRSRRPEPQKGGSWAVLGFRPGGGVAHLWGGPTEALAHAAASRFAGSGLEGYTELRVSGPSGLTGRCYPMPREGTG